MPAVIAASVRALRPGGWLLPGGFAGPPDELARLVTDLRTVRSGGHPWRAAEMLRELTAAGLATGAADAVGAGAAGRGPQARLGREQQPPPARRQPRYAAGERPVVTGDHPDVEPVRPPLRMHGVRRPRSGECTFPTDI